MRFSLSVEHCVIPTTASGTRFRFLPMLGRRSHAIGDGRVRNRFVVAAPSIAVSTGGAGSLDHHCGIDWPDAAQQGVRAERVFNALGSEIISPPAR